jgi:hypothetical protein
MRLLSLLCFLLAGASAMPAHADSLAWRLFIPVSSAAPDEHVNRVLRALELAAGEGALRNVTAAQQFEALRSHEPLENNDKEIATVEKLAKAANNLLGSDHLADGQRDLDRAEKAIAGEQGDAYRRDRDRVQTLFVACTLSAMLNARRQRRDKAATQMAHCVREYPGYAPEGEAEIQPLYDTAAVAVPHGLLHVDGVRGCVVRANGLELGQTPLDTTLPTGDYRLQIECASDSPGRVHVVRVGESATRFSADPLDATVHTKGGLWFSRAESSDADGEGVGRLFGAQVVLLIVDGDAIRVRTEGRDIAVLAAGDDVRPVIPLLETPTADAPAAPATKTATTPAPAPAVEVPAELGAEAPSRSPLEYVAGGSLALIGTGALAVGWVLYAQRDSIRDRAYGAAVSFTTQDRYHRLGAVMLGVSAFGAAAITAAEPFLVSDDGIPSAAWVLAMGGVALAGVGLGFGVAHHCAPQAGPQRFGGCGFVEDAAFGPLLALHALPLLALPAMYGLRKLFGGDSTVVLSFDGAAGRIAVGGTF